MHAILARTVGQDTLARVLAGHPECQVTEGDFDGRALAGDGWWAGAAASSLAFRSRFPRSRMPTFLKSALNAIREARAAKNR